MSDAVAIAGHNISHGDRFYGELAAVAGEEFCPGEDPQLDEAFHDEVVTQVLALWQDLVCVGEGDVMLGNKLPDGSP
jgi:hypothetical protein